MKCLQRLLICFVGFTLTGLLVTGCTPQLKKDKENGNHSHHDHEAGPFEGGKIIELGKEHDYHVEIVHNKEKKQLTVYILNDHAEDKDDAVAIEAKTIKVNIKGDEPVTVELKASPQETDKDGKSSRFVGTDDAFDVEELEGEIEVVVESGKDARHADFDLHHHDEDDDHDDEDDQ